MPPEIRFAQLVVDVPELVVFGRGDFAVADFELDECLGVRPDSGDRSWPGYPGLRVVRADTMSPAVKSVMSQAGLG